MATAARTPRRHRRLSGARAVFGTTQGAVGAILVLGIVLIVVVGPFIAPFDPTRIGVGVPATGPAADHLLGTDDLGRDIWSRFLTGGAELLVIPILAVTLAFAVGAALGLFFGYVGGRGDQAVMRVVDILLPIPTLLVALVLLARFGGSRGSLIVIVAFVFIPRIVRILRGAVQNIRSTEYVLASEARGERARTVVFRELMPNVAGPMLVEYGIRVNFAITFVAALNFLGLAAQPPSSNWGLMIAGGRSLIEANPAASLAPVFAIAILVIGINLLTDALAQRYSRDLSAAGLR